MPLTIYHLTPLDGQLPLPEVFGDGLVPEPRKISIPEYKDTKQSYRLQPLYRQPQPPGVFEEEIVPAPSEVLRVEPVKEHKDSKQENEDEIALAEDLDSNFHNHPNKNRSVHQRDKVTDAEELNSVFSEGLEHEKHMIDKDYRVNNALDRSNHHHNSVFDHSAESAASLLPHDLNIDFSED